MILHVAVMRGEADVVRQLMDLIGREFGGADGEPKASLDINAQDDARRTPADFLECIENEETRRTIQGLLEAKGAVYGNNLPVPAPNPNV
jgi:hypothetical protein